MMKLNRRQRVALFVGLVVAVVMGLFPPWEMEKPTIFPSTYSLTSLGAEIMGTDELQNQGVVLLRGTAGFHFVGSTKSPRIGEKKGKFSLRDCGYRVDLQKLFAMWFTVAFATAAAVILLGDWSKRTRQATGHE